jgi:hypothetical protein
MNTLKSFGRCLLTPSLIEAVVLIPCIVDILMGEEELPMLLLASVMVFIIAVKSAAFFVATRLATPGGKLMNEIANGIFLEALPTWKLRTVVVLVGGATGELLWRLYLLSASHVGSLLATLGAILSVLGLGTLGHFLLARYTGRTHK